MQDFLLTFIFYIIILSYFVLFIFYSVENDLPFYF